MRKTNPWLRPGAALMAITFGLGLARPLEAAPRAKTLAAAAEDKVAALDTGKATSPQTPETPSGATDSEHKSFFRTPKGIAALVLMVGVTGYTVHTRISDAVHSPGRK